MHVRNRQRRQPVPDQQHQRRLSLPLPGWQQLDLAASVETEIRISTDGRTVLGVDYNGVPR
jgi:hypothetical protein